MYVYCSLGDFNVWGFLVCFWLHMIKVNRPHITKMWKFRGCTENVDHWSCIPVSNNIFIDSLFKLYCIFQFVSCFFCIKVHIWIMPFYCLNAVSQAWVKFECGLEILLVIVYCLTVTHSVEWCGAGHCRVLSWFVQVSTVRRLLQNCFMFPSAGTEWNAIQLVLLLCSLCNSYSRYIIYSMMYLLYVCFR